MLVGALKRILKGQKSGRYEVRLEQAIAKAKVELDRELTLKDKGSAEQLKLLNNLLKSLERGSSNANTINKRWNALHDAGRIFINRDLKALTQGARTYERLDLDDRSDLALLKDGVSSARSIFAGKPGKTTPSPILDLIRATISIYKQMTGTEGGISSRELASSGPHYMTPLEELVLAVLSYMDGPYSIDATRELIRTAQGRRLSDFTNVESSDSKMDE